jgi:hypothetical protein
MAAWALASGLASADEIPAVRFTGLLNAIGGLDAISTSPQSISIPPGGAVSFVNATGTPLTLSVGGLDAVIPDGQTRTFTFPGTNNERDVGASATAVDLPLIGTLTSSTATVKVGALRAAPDPLPGSDPPSSGPSADSGSPSPVPAAEPGTATVAPIAASPKESVRAAARERAAGGGGPTRHRSAAGGSTAPAINGNFAAMPEATGTRKGTRVTTVGGAGSTLALLILVATVLLGGVGAAAIRSVLALRDGPRAAR